MPSWNKLVHFGVPRWHHVARVTADKKRYAVYGWVLTPKIQLLPAPVADLPVVDQMPTVPGALSVAMVLYL